MTPTPAQFKAAQDAYISAHITGDHFDALTAALTAAAEVDPEIARLEGKINLAYSKAEDLLAILDNRTAEVGEPRMPQMVAQQSARLDAQRIDAEIAATIERCKQAVWDAGGDNVEFHVAAIHALKDELRALTPIQFPHGTLLVNSTIEHCVQELEAAHAECSTLNLLHGAARLRALKVV